VAIVPKGLKDCMRFYVSRREEDVGRVSNIQFAKYTWLVTSLDVRL
jgi:hypothetical protein